MFLTLFRSTFCLPKEASWQLRKVPLPQLLLLTSTLRGQTLTLQQWMFQRANEFGRSGLPTVPIMATTIRSSKTYQQQDNFKSSWASLPAAVRAFGVEDTKSELTRLQSRFGTSARPLNWQDIPAPGSPKVSAPICT
jgi:hypothetical protein